jgi:hypothetical protein
MVNEIGPEKGRFTELVHDRAKCFGKVSGK